MGHVGSSSEASQGMSTRQTSALQAVFHHLLAPTAAEPWLFPFERQANHPKTALKQHPKARLRSERPAPRAPCPSRSPRPRGHLPTSPAHRPSTHRLAPGWRPAPGGRSRARSRPWPPPSWTAPWPSPAPSPRSAGASPGGSPAASAHRSTTAAFSRQQELHDGLVAVAPGQVQRAGAVAARHLLRVGPGGQQQPADLQVPAQGGHVQGRLAARGRALVLTRGPRPNEPMEMRPKTTEDLQESMEIHLKSM